MSRKLPILYSALLLTGVNLLLRFVGTSFQVFLSGKIGASGIGLLQLVMSVGSFSMISGIAGIRTATMYLTAEELGKKRKNNIPCVLSGCFLYSIICSTAVAFGLYSLSPWIAIHWINNPQTVNALRLYAGFLPVCCLCSVMTGYFTAANRIGTLAAVEVAEQFATMAVTIVLLSRLDTNNAVQACICVILGSCLGSCLTLFCLIYLYRMERFRPVHSINMRNRLLNTALPLALADILRSGISTTENLMVPKRLSMNRSVTDPLAAFGTVSGMVFPVLMFPACILYSLAELLIPELARCNAAGSYHRIRYLTQRSLKLSMLYGLFFAGLIFLAAEELCSILYDSTDAGKYLRLYSVLVPILYCDAITDATTKGLGQQKICVRNNILTSVMDVAILYFLLPQLGMDGYFISFLISHLVNYVLSLHLLLKITGLRIPGYIPILCVSAALLAGLVANHFTLMPLKLIAYSALLFSLLYLSGIIRKEDMNWLCTIVAAKEDKKTSR